ncbi:type II toxin-antitoxin system RelE/ParE family toxin [Citrobacter freundii]|uniref:type II toxin-antitoxin system RelE/ParE family toxin n=1 Tax=Citrobacter freundii TaxID=546 RepID=UPI0029388E25|nr:type II toxin-antitoxin system RelE/ParE family toxin [Citrobacter freundii]ELQ7797113.1 type II toxin-antitoxin system RelE/ParE family toxin [Citrobacter freundii]MEA8855319.1 type II toxin-antitoxin system RelE/ParE family toxin [Citrobacter freundii]
MSYKLTGEAQRDIIEIRDYTSRNWGAKQSREYLRKLQVVLSQLAEMPGMGHHRIDDFGEDIYSFPYVSHMIYYSIQDSDIVVLAVLHQSRAPTKHLGQRL